MSRYRNQIFIGLLLAFVIYVVYLLFADSQLQAEGADGIFDVVAQFPLWLVGPLILIQMVVIILRFIEWHYFLGVIDARDKISLFDSIVIFVSAFTMVVSPGKAAEILKSVFLKAKTGVPVARSAPIVLAERIVDGMAVIFIMAFTLLLTGDNLSLGEYNGIDYDFLSRAIIYSSALALIIGLIVVQIAPLAYFFLNIVRILPLLRRIHSPLVEFYESSREIFHLRHIVPMTLVGVLVYVVSSLGFMVVLYGFGMPFTWENFVQAAFITGVVSAVGALSFVPNGAGVSEVSNTGMLLALVAPVTPWMTPVVASAASLIQGFFHKWFRVIVGMAVAFIFRKRLFSDDLNHILDEMKASSAAAQESGSPRPLNAAMPASPPDVEGQPAR